MANTKNEIGHYVALIKVYDKKKIELIKLLKDYMPDYHISDCKGIVDRCMDDIVQYIRIESRGRGLDLVEAIKALGHDAEVSFGRCNTLRKIATLHGMLMDFHVNYNIVVTSRDVNEDMEQVMKYYDDMKENGLKLNAHDVRRLNEIYNFYDRQMLDDRI